MKQPVLYQGRSYSFTSEDARSILCGHIHTGKLSDRIMAAWQHAIVYTDIMNTVYASHARDLINDGRILSVRDYESMVTHQGRAGLF